VLILAFGRIVKYLQQEYTGMRKIVFLTVACAVLFSCKDKAQPATNAANETRKFHKILDDYWEERMQLFPLDATSNGDNRYNDRLTITIAQSFRDSLKRFYHRYVTELHQIDSGALNTEDQLSYRLFGYETEMNLQGLRFPTHYMPINQFWSFTLDLPQLGSGEGNQPFKTVKDYDNFLKRLSVFPAWTDTAIANMKQGIKTGWVLPKALAVKVLPQLKSMLVARPEQSIFYGAVKLMPDSFSAADKDRLTAAYTDAIQTIVIPNYKKLYEFFDKEYVPAARNTAGVNALPDGQRYYRYCSRYWTTTNLPPDSIFALGQAEVTRLEDEMNRVKDETGFKGDLHAFFEFLNKDKQFYPFTTPKQVLDSFWAIKKQEDPELKRLFSNVPKAPFTIRQTEAFRAASASAEYNPASEDGSRPGIFYVPIIDAAKFNAVGMETLFLHEAIPGHHYQISLQQENKNLPKFRRFLWYGAYGEGWALYSETLGRELGLFKNPYQYFGHLSDAMHRAIRLVVDVGMHAKGMTREEAIDYMMAHERITKEEATAEIERYMAIPGQALSYKIGQLTISEERHQYEVQLGSKFNIASFHEEVLKDGCLPLKIMQEKLRDWARKKMKQ
jgi:uncharacterized protein (DUF885 family)